MRKTASVDQDACREARGSVALRRGLRRVILPVLLAGASLAASAPRVAEFEAAPPASSDDLAVRHLRLLRSEPGKDTTVTEAPRELRLWFSQRPEIALTTARISRGNHNAAVGRAVIRPWDGEGVLVVIPIQDRLENGRHVVSWRTMATDGHVITGEFAFTVAARGTSGTS